MMVILYILPLMVSAQSYEKERYVVNEFSKRRVVRNTYRECTMIYVPKIQKNLLSVDVCTRKGFKFVFKSGVLLGNNIYRLFFRVKLQEQQT